MRYAIDENAIQTSAPWNELKSVPPDTLIIAHFSPGFNMNLSRWSLSISENGQLLQTVKVNERRIEGGELHIIDERRVQSAQLEIAFVNDLLAQATAIINKSPIPHSGWMMTDGPVRTLKASVDGQMRNVPDYEFTDDYRKLWEDVHRYAPYNPWR